MGLLEKDGASPTYKYSPAPATKQTDLQKEQRSNSAASNRMQAQADAYEKQQKAAADKVKADKAAADKAAADKAAKVKSDQLKKDLAAKASTTTTKTAAEIAAARKASMVAIGNADDLASTPFTITIKAESGGSGGGSAGGSNAAANVATPTNSPAIKVATPDIITIDQETLPAELMTSLIFENIGGQELLSISRHDLISGSNLDYQSIKNLNEIYINHNSLNIIPMPDSSTVYSKNFPISWDSHIVEEFSSADSTHILIDSVAKELQILVTNMKPGEQIG